MPRFSVILVVALFGCIDQSSPSEQTPQASPMDPATKPAGMSKYTYLAADGGPHLLLPAEVAGLWTSAPSVASAMDPRSDYGRACAATTNTQMALISVGSTSAVVFADPPMTAWGKSADGLVDVYYLESWSSTELDALIERATAALPTASLTDSGNTLHFRKSDAFLLFAGDTVSSTAYGVNRVTIPVGKYKLLVGKYSASGESVTIYRLKPDGR